jgi:hypothetical protein
MLSPENGVRGSRDVPPRGKGFQSALLNRNTEGGSVSLSQCLHSKAGGHHETRVAAEATRGKTWLPIVHMIRHREPQGWHEYRSGRDSEVAGTLWMRHEGADCPASDNTAAVGSRGRKVGATFGAQATKQSWTKW